MIVSGWTPAASLAQARRSIRWAWLESMSSRRLERVFAEEDRETEVRLQKGSPMAYKFECRHCHSKFSLQQQLDAHEPECGKVGTAGERPEPAAPPEAKTSAGKQKPCKYCGELFDNFGEYGKHRWEKHRDLVLADLAKSRAARKVDERKIDVAMAGTGTSQVASAPQRKPQAPAPKNGTNGTTCPTCGGHLPASTAELVTELTKMGVSEVQAFEAARIARRIFTAGAAA